MLYNGQEARAGKAAKLQISTSESKHERKFRKLGEKLFEEGKNNFSHLRYEREIPLKRIPPQSGDPMKYQRFFDILEGKLSEDEEEAEQE